MGASSSKLVMYPRVILASESKEFSRELYDPPEVVVINDISKEKEVSS